MKNDEKGKIAYDTSFYRAEPPEESGEMPDELDETVEYSDYEKYYYLTPDCFNSIDTDLLFKMYGRDYILHQSLRLTSTKIKETEADFYSFSNLGQFTVAEARLNFLKRARQYDQRTLLRILRDTHELLAAYQRLEEKEDALRKTLKEKQMLAVKKEAAGIKPKK